MTLPTAYLTSTKNLSAILSSVQTAQAPSRFTLSFLEQLEHKSSSDRLIINVLKALGFLTADGSPTERYYRYLDQSEAPRVLAEGLRDAYADLFQLNRAAYTLSRAEVKNKIKTLTQGKVSDDVANKMASTFLELSKLADFDMPTAVGSGEAETEISTEAAGAELSAPPMVELSPSLGLSGLVYNIQIHLPESRDPAVYDALFRSLRSHLLAP